MHTEPPNEANGPDQADRTTYLVPTRTIEVRFSGDDAGSASYYRIAPFQVADGWAAVGGPIPWDESRLHLSSSHESLSDAVTDVFGEILVAEALESDLEELTLTEDESKDLEPIEEEEP